MKPNFYKTNGIVVIETPNSGGIAFIERGIEKISLNEIEMEFLMKCFTELLEE